MLSNRLHARLIGRPGRAACLERFLDYVLEHAGVWVCGASIIARTGSPRTASIAP